MANALAGKLIRVCLRGSQMINDYRVEGMWKDITGKSWKVSAAEGEDVAIVYADRVENSGGRIPPDDNVLFGKINGASRLIHGSEIVKQKET